jgi:PPOX class probable FMN-dependent enzyme
MTLAPWRPAIARALHRNRSLPHVRYLQLATVRPDGRPANRTLVFRGFWGDTNQLQFVTDARSAKPQQITRQPWAEVCWYFPTTREQFRLLGQLQLIDQAEQTEAQSARQSAWQALSDSARSQFAWGEPRAPRGDAASFSPPQPSQTEPLPQFCLLLLDPVEVDHLELRGEPQNRRIYELRSGEWCDLDVNP